MSHGGEGGSGEERGEMGEGDSMNHGAAPWVGFHFVTALYGSIRIFPNVSQEVSKSAAVYDHRPRGTIITYSVSW